MTKKLNLNKGLSQFREEIKELTILPELKEYIPALTEEESKLLEESILTEGVREPLDIWFYNEEYILIDGHNRYGIIKKHQLPFSTKEHKFSTIKEVKEWMLKKQLGRRNLTDESRTLLIGLLYNKSKNQRGGNQKNEKRNNKAKEIAEQTGSSEKSIKNAGDFAKGVDKLSNELKQEVLTGKSKLKKAQIQQLGKTDTPTDIKTHEEVEKHINSSTKKPGQNKAKTEIQKVDVKSTPKRTDYIPSLPLKTQIIELIDKEKLTSEEQYNLITQLINHFKISKDDLPF